MYNQEKHNAPPCCPAEAEWASETTRKKLVESLFIEERHCFDPRGCVQKLRIVHYLP